MANLTYPGVRIEEAAAKGGPIRPVETGVPVLIGYGPAAAGPVELRSPAEFDERFGRNRYRLGEAVRLFFENGGRRCYVVAIAEGGRPSALDFHAGLAAAKAVEDADLAALPDAVLLGIDEYGALMRYLLKDCARMRRFAVIENREGAELGELWLSWGAAYQAPAGKAAGLFAAEDAAIGPWKAPTELHGGTLAREGAWKYAAVRRLSIFIERSIEEGLDWVVFEPNPALFARVRELTEAFLLGLWHKGALVGADPALAFFVRCDGTVMGQEDLEKGDFIVEVSIAPLKPSEFVVLRIVLRAGA